MDTLPVEVWHECFRICLDSFEEKEQLCKVSRQFFEFDALLRKDAQDNGSFPEQFPVCRSSLHIQ